MQLGYFAMPSHPPERPLKDGHDWDLQVLRWLDELGYTEAWIGEHHTAPWEPHPSPDLLVAQALMQTKNIRLGPGGFLLPYHHPAELANRVAMLDHMSGGRLNFGVAASGLPSDWAMFNVDGMSGVNRDMTREALDIILKLWSATEPFEYKGKFWHVNRPGEMFGVLRPHLKPLQSPHPPIGVAGLSKGSDTVEVFCGEEAPVGQQGLIDRAKLVDREELIAHPALPLALGPRERHQSNDLLPHRIRKTDAVQQRRCLRIKEAAIERSENKDVFPRRQLHLTIEAAALGDQAEQPSQCVVEVPPFPRALCVERDQLKVP